MEREASAERQSAATKHVDHIEFSTAGSPREVARAIEEFARAEARVAALVVPWESDAHVVSIAVTAQTGDGWAIEHINLGTLTLTEASAATRVAIDPDARTTPPLAAVFEGFTRQLQRKFAAAP
jgi:hypothetical protein